MDKNSSGIGGNESQQNTQSHQERVLIIDWQGMFNNVPKEFFHASQLALFQWIQDNYKNYIK